MLYFAQKNRKKKRCSLALVCQNQFIFIFLGFPLEPILILFEWQYIRKFNILFMNYNFLAISTFYLSISNVNKRE